ncbi:[protein-PII] uridylyltransferase [Moraxella nasovis]|uniref:[protein-PII] uridylyltransferase n=1 Tax=Moraxella nasovis TaxID=2904121 RepID=UPI001F606848|nr:[protein-PII] uridylyltransferase [Moraxella nasovis]UNU73969.1 [protein-PII] uridylyltransferase [Moraxella nasovis]
MYHHDFITRLSENLSLTIPPLSEHQGIANVNAKIKSWLNLVDKAIDERMVQLGWHGVDQIKQLVQLRTACVDHALITLFNTHSLPNCLAMFAVGGYGRGELLPQSDVDILLFGEGVDDSQEIIESFVASLWDIGITPAISVRTPAQTNQAIHDQTIATALLEARFLTGNKDFIDLPNQLVTAAWHAKDFFNVKINEAKTRYLSQNATEYNLEPNLKLSPGALRDLHIIMWLGKFVFNDVQTWSDLAKVGFLDAETVTSLQDAQAFLWCMRHHLHTLTGRPEDRLLFDHQKSLAIRMGFATLHDEHTKITQALEAMMRQYYRHAMKLAALSKLLCAYFNEKYLNPTYERRKLDDDFYQVRELTSQNHATTSVIISDSRSDNKPNNAAFEWQICATNANLFTKKPDALLRIFLVMGRENIKHIHASTLKSLYTASDIINESYRNNPTHQALFLANLQETNLLFHRLRTMARYGVLSRYLPDFGKITGLMQYDLFHRYTVDAHTLLLLRVLHRFGDKHNETYQQKFGLVSEIYRNINRKDILVIAALFHDIAKGRGGDHSQLGEGLSYEFCKKHGMTDVDSQLVAWLVREHLTMSLAAQKKDISDPQVIADFADFVGSITRLNHLYVLTVADMNATNSQLWNTWRASLLKQLYLSTRRVLSLGAYAADKDVVIDNRKQKAKALLGSINDTALDNLWRGFGEDFFLKQKHADIAWQSEVILAHKTQFLKKTPIITLQHHSDLALGAVSLFICTQNQNDLFAKTVCVLDKMGLSVLDATILTVHIDGVPAALDVYVLLDRFAAQHDKNDILSDFNRQNQLQQKLVSAFEQTNCPVPTWDFITDGKLKHFSVPTQVNFEKSKSIARPNQHAMTLITKDRPALLAKVGSVFSKLDIEVHGARITTLGERAEDMFFISGENGQALDEKILTTLKSNLLTALP